MGASFSEKLSVSAVPEVSVEVVETVGSVNLGAEPWSYC